MSVELPRDAEGREIPLDTTSIFGVSGKAYNIVRWEYITGFDEGSQTAHKWYGITEFLSVLEPEKLLLTPPDSWEKLEEDIRRIGTDDCTWFCGYANENPVENACPDSCKFFKGDEITCRKKLADDILSRIRKLRGDTNAD